VNIFTKEDSFTGFGYQVTKVSLTSTLSQIIEAFVDKSKQTATVS